MGHVKVTGTSQIFVMLAWLHCYIFRYPLQLCICICQFVLSTCNSSILGKQFLMVFLGGGGNLQPFVQFI